MAKKATASEKKADLTKTAKDVIPFTSIHFYRDEDGKEVDKTVNLSTLTKTCIEARAVESNMELAKDRKDNFTAYFGDVLTGLGMEVCNAFPALSESDKSEEFNKQWKDLRKHIKEQMEKHYKDNGETDKKAVLPRSAIQASSDVKQGIAVGVDLNTCRTWSKVRKQKMELAKENANDVGKAESLQEIRAHINKVARLVTEADPELTDKEKEQLNREMVKEWNKANAKLYKDIQARIEKMQAASANKAAEPETKKGTDTETGKAKAA